MQVHAQKGDIGDGVDKAQCLAELNRIKQLRPVAQLHQVAQVQVAVAFAHLSGGLACSQQRLQALALALRPVVQCLQRAPLGLGQGQCRQGVKVSLRLLAHQRGAAPVGTRRGFGGAGVQVRYALGQGAQVRGQHSVGVQPLGQQLALSKTLHLHAVFQHYVVRLHVGQRHHARRGCGANQRHDHLIQLRRGAAVDAQLLLAGLAPLGQRAKVQKAQRQRFFELVSPLAGQHHPRDMRFNAARISRQRRWPVQQRLQPQRAPVSGFRGVCHSVYFYYCFSSLKRLRNKG